MSLEERIRNARTLLRSGRLANEASVSSGVVLPLLDALGWPAFDPSTVAPEYSVGGRRVDFALLTHGRPAVFVEVKQPGLADGADRQLFEYAFHEGVPMAILTDGATWHVYLPAMQGSYDDRRVYYLDVVEREVEESAARLRRYLSRDAVESGTAFDRAREDYQRARQRRGASEAIPQAWANLLSEQDPALATPLAGEVERISGFEVEPADLWTFLASLRPQSGAIPEGKRRPLPKTRAPRRPAPAASVASSTASSSTLPGPGYRIGGAFVSCRMGRDVLEGVFRALAQRDPSFPEQFAGRVTGKKRAYVARTPADLYPGRPEFESQSAEVAPGWVIATHSSSAMKLSLIQKACDVAGLRFGTDVEVQMP